MIQAFLYGVAFILGAAIATVLVLLLIGAIEMYRNPHSLNPEWDATRTFIKSLPTKKRKRK